MSSAALSEVEESATAWVRCTTIYLMIHVADSYDKCLSIVPAFAPVCFPFLTVGSPFTITYSIPEGN
jgi:hypothetical protein